MDTTFEERVIAEIAEDVPGSRKAALAGLAAIVQCTGQYVQGQSGDDRLILKSQRQEPLTKSFTLIRKTFNISVESDPGESGIEVIGEPARQLMRILFGVREENGSVPDGWTVDSGILINDSCIRSFLANQFLCVGTVHDPSKDYYLAFELQSEKQADQTAELLTREGIALRPSEGGRKSVLRTRDSAVIVDVLNLMGAHVSMMDLENARIMRQVRNRVNRKVNCETSNIRKTAVASSKQLDEIRMLQDSPVWKTIPASLREIAVLREKYPESSLQELGNMLNPPIGKSGVNHRLRRLSAIAEELQKHS